MSRSSSSHSHRDEKSKSSRPEDYTDASRSRTEDERLRRRREWMLQQQREREHERLKQKMIMEYEIRRAKEKGLPVPKRRSAERSCSKSRSTSRESPQRRTPVKSSKSSAVMSQKVESSNGTTQQLFKGPEGTQISATELRRIKVDIFRNIPVTAPVKNDLQRDIIDPEEVVVKRREGEGSKPIFEREELKKGTIVKPKEVEEHRTVMTVDQTASGSRSEKSRKRSESSSPVRKRDHSPYYTSSRHSRREVSSHRDERTEHRSSSKGDRYRSRERSRERRDRHKTDDRRRSSSHTGEDHSDRSRRRNRHERSRSGDADNRRSDRGSRHRSDREDRSYRDYRDRSRDRSRERRDRNRSEERRPPPQYIEQVPVPVYYGNFPPRPIVVGPLVPFRGQVPMYRVRHPPVMGPVRPMPPRFMPPDAFRGHPRFGRMF